MMAQGALIWCPFPDAEAARTAICVLLDEHLIACGNILPGVESLFAWQGARAEGAECGALLKTSAAGMDIAIARLEAIHPYDVPAIAGWRVAVPPATAGWLASEIS